MMRPERCWRKRMAACFTTVNVPFRVDRDHVVPFLLRHVEDHPVPQDAGAGDNNVQLAEVVDGRLDDCFPALHRGDGLGAGGGRASRLVDLRRHHLGDGLVEAPSRPR